jgi:hypothetical protein
MAYQHKEGSGTLFPNKKTKDTHPDWKGDALVNGVLMEIAGWDKGGRISLSIKKKEPRPQGARQPDEPQREAVDTSYVDNPPPKSDLPF